MSGQRRYFILVDGEKIEVSHAVYHTYYSMRRHEKTLVELDMRNRLTYYSNLDTEETCGEEMLSDRTAAGVEETALLQIYGDALRRSIERLSPWEQDMVFALFYEGLSERQLSKRTGVHHMTIHNQKVRILGKLKKWLEE